MSFVGNGGLTKLCVRFLFLCLEDRIFFFIFERKLKHGVIRQVHQSFHRCGLQADFRSVRHKDLLIDFLNNLLGGEKQIKDISFLDKELLPEFQGDRGTIYTTFIRRSRGEEFIVEMQNCEQAYIRERAIYYLCRAMSRQGERGANWKFNLKAVYGIFS